MPDYYEAEAVFHQGTDREYTLHETVGDLESAVRTIEHWASGRVCRAWINNKQVNVRNGHVYGADGEPFCTNPVWHDLLAPISYPKIRPKRMSDYKPRAYGLIEKPTATMEAL